MASLDDGKQAAAASDDIGAIDWSSLSRDPDHAWEKIASLQSFVPTQFVVSCPKETPRSAGFTRFVCTSDTHTKHGPLVDLMPEGDVFIHTGDFTTRGTVGEIKDFCTFLDLMPHKHKIVVPGNHDIALDAVSYPAIWKQFLHPSQADTAELIAVVRSHCTFLLNEACTINGIRIFGSPHQPQIGDWAFGLERGPPSAKAWSMIPSDTNLLLTHGPPVGRGDVNLFKRHTGCVDLLEHVQSRVKPKVHVFGHIHEGYGVSSDGVTDFVNAAALTLLRQPRNVPIVFDLPNGNLDETPSLTSVTET